MNIAAILALSLTLLAQSDPVPTLVFENVTVVDATGGPSMSGTTVVVSGSRIAAVGQSRVPANAIVVDGTGKYLIPGLWDMHAHWSEPGYLPLFTANGITGMRVMKGARVHHEWRAKVEKGEVPGPRLLVASELVDGPTPVHEGSIAVGDGESARQAVVRIKQSGADFIKIYSLLPRDAYFSLAEAAKTQGLPIAGHVPRSITTGEASDAGQASISHLSGAIFATSGRETELPDDLAGLREELAAGGNYLILLRRLEARHAATHDLQKAEALYRRFRENGTWQCPTLLTVWTPTRFNDPEFLQDPRLKYLSPQLRASWQPENHSVYRHVEAGDYRVFEKVFTMHSRMVGAMNKAGVGILACTDTPLPYIFPGFSLHEEMALMVDAGLTPIQALQSATLNPAQFLGREEDFGTIEAGKLADLVLLDADPLDDIRHTQRIDSVVVAGKLMTRAELDEMLAEVERKVAASAAVASAR